MMTDETEESLLAKRDTSDSATGSMGGEGDGGTGGDPADSDSDDTDAARIPAFAAGTQTGAGAV